MEAERGVPSKSLSPESHSLDLAPDTWVGELWRLETGFRALLCLALAPSLRRPKRSKTAISGTLPLHGDVACLQCS